MPQNLLMRRANLQKDAAAAISSDAKSLLDILILNVGVAAYSNWWRKEQGQKKRDRILNDGVAAAKRYSGKKETGLEEYVKPLTERADGKSLLPFYRQAMVSAKAEKSAIKTYELSVMLMRWLQRHPTVLKEIFESKKTNALKFAKAVSSTDPKTIISALAAIPSSSRIRVVRTWVGKAANKMGVEPSDEVQLQIDVESTKPIIEDLQTVTTALDNSVPESGDSADLDAAKTVLESELQDAAQSSIDPIAVSTAAAATIAAQPTSSVAQQAGLNEEQTRAMLAEGRQLHVAGAGSGKTRTMVAKIAHWVKEKGISPEAILATSFTRKSAAELKARCDRLFGISGDMIGRTTDSITYNIVSQFRPHLRPALRNLGNSDILMKIAYQQVTLKRTAGGGSWGGGRRYRRYAAYGRGRKGGGKYTQYWKEPIGDWFNLGETPTDAAGNKVGPKRLGTQVQFFQSTGVTPEQARKDHSGGSLAFAAAMYGAYDWLKRNDPQYAPCMDFNDILRESIDIVENDTTARNVLHRRFKMILVDEGQDQNALQRRFFLALGEKSPTVAFIGDDKQCLAKTSRISTPSGPRKLENLREGDQVLSYRNGKITVQTLRYIVPSSWSWGYKVQTENGHSLTMSPNHKLWASAPTTTGDGVIVYLMFRPDLGYRVGITNKGRRVRGEDYYNSFGGRAFLEKAERLWVLKVCSSREDALLEENTLSLEFGIPTCVFEGEHRGLNQKRLNKIFAKFGQNGLRLLEERGLDFDLPHWMSQGYTKHGRSRHVIRLVAHSSQGTQVTLEWPDESLNECLLSLPPSSKGHIFTARKQGGFRVRRYFSNYREGLKFAQKLQELSKAILSQELSVPSEGRFRYVNASSLMPGMEVLREDGDGGIEKDVIVSVEKIDGEFLDIDVEDASNLFAEGLLTSNSIYAFRGADPIGFKDLETQGFEVYKMTMNFRSGKEIVDSANRLIAHNEDRQIRMTCRADVDRKGMGSIHAVQPETHDEGAQYTANEIESAIASGASPADFGVVVRNNAEADAYALALMSKGIPFRSKVNYFNRAQVKVMVAWARLATAKGTQGELNDALLSAHITPGFYLDKKFAGELARQAKGSYLDYILSGQPVYTGRNAWRNKNVKQYAEAIDKLQDKAKGSSTDLLRSILDVQGTKGTFMEALTELVNPEDLGEETENIDPTKEEIEEAAKAPIKPLLTMAEHFSDPINFLGFIDKMVAANTKNRKDDDSPEPAVTIDTVHQWKGLECKHAFVCATGGVFPNFRSDRAFLNGDETAYDEERRLAYTAITRGEDSVTMICPGESYLGKEAGLSRFITEACISVGSEATADDPEEQDVENARVASMVADTRFIEALVMNLLESDDGKRPVSELQSFPTQAFQMYTEYEESGEDETTETDLESGWGSVLEVE